MAVFCNNCGKELKPGTKFCENCGSPVIHAEANAPKAEEPRPVVEPMPKQEPKKEYVDEPAFAPTPVSVPIVPEENRPLGPWAYFGYSLLFSIPIVGFILLIVFSFAGRNVNRKNFARSYWCRFILILAFVLIFVVIVLTGVFRDAFGELARWLHSIGLDWLARIFA